jgi:hypothetical protein
MTHVSVRRASSPFARAAALVVVVGAAVGLSQGVRRSELFDATQLLRDLQVLSADDMQGRQVGTPGGEKARAYVLRRFKESGIQPFGSEYAQPFSFAGGRAANQPERKGVNVVGVINGTKTPRRYIVLTAHYDHIGVRDGQVFNGADDNASGTAALFAIGKYFSARPPANSLLVAAFDGEESGLRGARAFVAARSAPVTSMALNVNLDMIGRAPDDRLFAAGTYAYPFLKPYLERVAAKAPVKFLFGHDDPQRKGVQDWTRDSDHFAFHEAKVPFVYFGVEDFDQHHKATDDYETMSFDFYVRTVETIIRVLEEFDANLEAIAAAARKGGEPHSQSAVAPERWELTTARGALTASLMVPQGVRRLPVVVLVPAGDGTRGLPAADALAAEGIASLMPEALDGTRVETAADLAAWITRLRNDSRFERIMVLGGGAGRIAALRAARAARADGIVLVDASESAKAAVREEMNGGRIPFAAVDLSSVETLGRFVRAASVPRHPEGERRSPRETVMTEIGGSRISIEYGRPSKRGRVIWGTLVPWGRWWMPGADEGTTFTTSRPLEFGSLKVPAGDYTIYTVPGDTAFVLIINQDTGVFHTTYHPDRDLGRVEMQRTTPAAPAEQLTFAIEPREGGGALKLSWDDREYVAPFVVSR